jgi:hypothetical protein
MAKYSRFDPRNKKSNNDKNKYSKGKRMHRIEEKKNDKYKDIYSYTN